MRLGDLTILRKSSSPFQLNLEVSQTKWALTLALVDASSMPGIKEGAHAVIFLEGKDEQDRYFIRKLHLMVSSEQSSAVVQDKDITRGIIEKNAGHVECVRRTDTLMIERDLVNNIMLKGNGNGTAYDKGIFCVSALLGWHSIFNLPIICNYSATLNVF